MAGQPKGRKLYEVLVEHTEEILGRLGKGELLHEVAPTYGIWPDQIDKFFREGGDELREKYRMALVKQKAMGVIVAAKGGKKTGRPKKGTKEKTNAELVAEHAERILLEMADGMTVTEVARHLMVRRSDIWAYFHQSQELEARYESAKTEGSHAHAERALLIPMEGVALDAVDARVMEMQVESSKWFADKMNPAQYGAKQQVDLKANLSGSVSINISTEL